MTLRLGRDTGSLHNHLYSRMTRGQPDPEVGMGATVLMWTDRHAATITEVSSKGTLPDGTPRWIVGVREDRAIVISGSEYDGSAEYRYEPNPEAPVRYWRFDGDKGWRQVRHADRPAGKRFTNRWVLADGPGLRIGERREYRDPSF